MTRILALTLLTVLLSAAPARAESEVVALPPGTQLGASPVWAGERLVWVEGCCRVVVREPSGQRRTLDAWTLRPEADRVQLSLAASAERVAVFRDELVCPGDCKYMEFRDVHAELRAGPPEGPLSTEPSCADGDEAVRAVTGRAIALSCAFGSELLVRDPDLGAERRFPTASAAVALAGPWLALRTDTRVAVLDRRTGQERYGVAAAGRGPVAVDEQGRVAFAPAADGDDLVLASPEEPQPRPLAISGRDARLAGGRIAARRADGTVTVAELSGAVVGTARIPEPAPWSFDGRRVAYPRSPCLTAVITVWDAATGPPPPLAGCGRLAIRSATLGRDGALGVTVRCAGDAGVGGCAAELGVRTLPPRSPNRGSDVASRFVALAAGQTRRVRLPRRRAVAEHLRRARRPRVRVDLGPPNASAPALSRVVAVRVARR